MEDKKKKHGFRIPGIDFKALWGKLRGIDRGEVAAKAADLTIDTVSVTLSSILKVFGSVLLVILLTGLIFACIFAYYVKSCLSSTLDISLEDYQLSESSTIWYTDSTGGWKQLVTLTGSEKRIWVDYDKIPWYMEKALVSIEDKRFYEHKGVDWYRTAGAFVEMFARMSDTYGGSTITQQLIKNLTGKNEVTVQRKLSEIFGALELEKKYDKREIIEWYLNAVYFGEGCWGVQTAAQTYFGKDVSDLSLAECAAIVGITNKPTQYDPFYDLSANKKRQETILHEMYEQGFINYEEYKNAVAEPLNFVYRENTTYTQDIYSYYEEVVIADVTEDLMERKGISKEAARHLVYNGGYQIFCCLDERIQANIDSIYQNIDNIPVTYGTDKQLQSAIVVMDPYTGEIKGLSGGVGEKTQNFPLNRATGSQRPPGSAIKPISVYGPAVELLGLTPNTLVNDSSDMYLSGTSWYPHNDSWENYGIITIYDALTLSLNTVSAQIVDKLGPETCYSFLRDRLGVTSVVPDDASYAPMALGQLTNGITVREMAQAYSAFVNDGIFTYSRTYTRITDSKGDIVIDNTPRTVVAFKPNTAYVMTYMMQNAVENGTGGAAYLGTVPVAGKTGTSGENKDRWFVGCTPYYVAAVWTGYDIPETINVWNNPAARIWHDVMVRVHSGLEYRSFPWPYIGGDSYLFGDLHPALEEQIRAEEEALAAEAAAAAAAEGGDG